MVLAFLVLRFSDGFFVLVGVVALVALVAEGRLGPRALLGLVHYYYLRSGPGKFETGWEMLNRAGRGKRLQQAHDAALAVEVVNKSKMCQL